MGRPRSMVGRVARMVRRAESRAIWRVVDRVEALDPAALVEAGVRGVLLDADGTLVPHRARTFSPSVRAWVEALIAAGLRVAIYSNADDLDALEGLGVPVVRGVKKPAIAGFRAALRVVDLPAEAVVMVGDNLISDGGAVDAGLRFVWCRPLPGHEPPVHRLTRWLAARAIDGGQRSGTTGSR